MQETGVSFANVKSYNLDEYYPIAHDSPQSYHYFMHHHLFDHIDIARDAIHIPSGNVPESQVDQACAEYEHQIAAIGMHPTLSLSLSVSVSLFQAATCRGCVCSTLVVVLIVDDRQVVLICKSWVSVAMGILVSTSLDRPR
jgi:hypothetical protein